MEGFIGAQPENSMLTEQIPADFLKSAVLISYLIVFIGINL